MKHLNPEGLHKNPAYTQAVVALAFYRVTSPAGLMGLVVAMILVVEGVRR
ncbi:MAG: hypothetical protein M3305_00635 [Actinomycetota bacterium]|nr:hypothetical protein [Actinomycetota bacterium]